MNNKQIKAAHNESNQARLYQHLNRYIAQGSDDDIDIDEIAMRTNDSTRIDE